MYYITILLLFAMRAHAVVTEAELDEHIEQWKVRQLIKELESLHGASCTSMVSHALRASDSIGDARGFINEEVAQTSNVKSRVNRDNILSALTIMQAKLKLYKVTPKNGLILFAGLAVDATGKEKKVGYAIEPKRAVQTKFYMCGKEFNIDALKETMVEHDKFGFIIICGSGTLFGLVCGRSREKLYEYSVDLPKKHGRGGQSAMRFSRLRLEKRHNYVVKVAELAKQYFLKDEKPNIVGLIIGGPADFKGELTAADFFDQKLKDITVKPLLDLSYGGDTGFSLAVQAAQESIATARLTKERRLIQKLFDEIDQDTGKYCFGVADTLKALEDGAVDTLILWEEMPILRVLRRKGNGEETLVHVPPDQTGGDEKFYKDPETGENIEEVSKVTLVEYLVDNYINHGAKLEMVTDQSPEGTQFCLGLGGIGALLRFSLDKQPGKEM